MYAPEPEAPFRSVVAVSVSLSPSAIAELVLQLSVAASPKIVYCSLISMRPMGERVNLPYQEQARFERIAIFFEPFIIIIFVVLSCRFFKVTVDPVYEDVSS